MPEDDPLITQPDLLIAKVECLSSGQVAITPHVADDLFEFIYRAACGVQWKVDESRFLSPSDSALSGRTSYTITQNIDALSCAMISEFGRRIAFTEETRWIGIGHELREELKRKYAN
jgi:hypothetical protein